ncbi:hypothetical protein [Salicibibacter kimchii]|uniref:Uncharacterized protein n=1 Tax=Salicibibacter kimchii TaxID=2099786 RepID=A0A345BUK6_9BACI|nr:hypothetical protein [Salicibibacter kimchii]AXF54637.1 hypothetical protein DT065_00480 [Salicibibacter kimchii]
MVINADFIKYQMNYVGISTYYLWKMTGIAYSTLSDAVTGKRHASKLSAQNYDHITSVLFTDTEKLLIKKSMFNIKEYEKLWKMLAESTLNDDAKIYRSGGVYHDEEGNPKDLPVSVELQFSFLNDKHLNSLRIFDKDLYNSLDNKGQRDKKRIVSEYLKDLQ